MLTKCRRRQVVRMKRFTITSLVVGLITLVFVLHFPFSNGNDVSAQRRRGPRSTAARRPLVDYSRFFHTTRQHLSECKTCHKVPTANWKQVSEFPDVADFPDHDACVGCHRPQFFKGAQPVICSGCHMKTSPRDSARFEFRNPSRPRQFTIEFPHDKHQDVIARVDITQTYLAQAAGFRSWAHARSTPPQSLPATRYNNCELCHVGNTKPIVKPASGWIDGFAPESDFFKASPETHASCFNCHWRGVQPTKDDCAGCHKPASSFMPSAIVLRKSMKFTHAREQHVKECTACHINITKATSLKGLKPDVPITACSECHNKDGLRLDVSSELQAIDKNTGFVCSYCHTSDVGRLDPPGSHYLISSRRPMKRKDVK